ncbi:MAG: hypothetical protein HQM08_30265 [Candidatus Riflebacteria bacterium]|nr:hypothetical protein [Candidatus Riflebacteria bacterium]
MKKIKKSSKLANIKEYKAYLARISEGENLSGAELKNFHPLEKEIEKEKKEDNFSSDQAVAKSLGISRQAVILAVSTGRLRQNPDGTFSKSAVEDFEEIRKGGRPKLPVNKEIEAADLRYKLAKAEKMEIDLKETRGLLMRRIDVERAFTERAYEFSRSRISQGESAIAWRLNAKTIL